jgi:putative addiction module killer protein
MKTNHDFGAARRGAVVPSSSRKVRITIRLDRDVLDWFRSKVEAQGGGNYQTMLNDALRAHTEQQDQSLEKLLRRLVREEIKKASWKTGEPAEPYVAKRSAGHAGDVKPGGEGVSELRIDYGPGYRVYFMKRGSAVVILLAGGDKRTQAADIRTALRLARNL